MSFNHLPENSNAILQNTLDPLNDCRFDIETAAHIVLHCHNFIGTSVNFFWNGLSQIDQDVLGLKKYIYPN